MAPVERDLIEVEVTPVSPFRLPRRNGGDRIVHGYAGGLRRLLVKDGAPVVVSVRASGGGNYRFRARPVPPEQVSAPGSPTLVEADCSLLEAALEDFRFSLGIDEDMTAFRDAFIGDPLLGPAIRQRIESRSSRRADPWEALAWAVTEQLIAYRRAAAIQRRMIHRWGMSVEVASPIERRHGGDRLRTAPTPEAIAAASPAELQACDLSAKRALALVRCAKEVSLGRTNLRDRGDDRRLLAIPEIGPWTVACLALRGRGDPDALPAGDLGHVKLVGALAGLGRPAEIEEVEEFYAPYAPYRGIAGDILLATRGRAVSGPGNRTRIRSFARPVRAA